MRRRSRSDEVFGKSRNPRKPNFSVDFAWDFHSLHSSTYRKSGAAVHFKQIAIDFSPPTRKFSALWKALFRSLSRKLLSSDHFRSLSILRNFFVFHSRNHCNRSKFKSLSGTWDLRQLGNINVNWIKQLLNRVFIFSVIIFDIGTVNTEASFG